MALHKKGEGLTVPERKLQSTRRIDVLYISTILLFHDTLSHLDCKERITTKGLFLELSNSFHTVLPNQLTKDLLGFIKETWLIDLLAQFPSGWSRQVKLDEGLSAISETKVGVP